MRLNICSGINKLEGYLGVDIEPHENVDLVHNILKPFPYEDGSVETIWSCATMEHFYYPEARKIVKEFHRLLEAGGVLEIAVPSMEKVGKAILDGTAEWEHLHWAIYGQRVDEYDYHRILWSFATLSELLEKAGFIEIVEVPYTSGRHRQFDYMMQVEAAADKE